MNQNHLTLDANYLPTPAQIEADKALVDAALDRLTNFVKIQFDGMTGDGQNEGVTMNNNTRLIFSNSIRYHLGEVRRFVALAKEPSSSSVKTARLCRARESAREVLRLRGALA